MTNPVSSVVWVVWHRMPKLKRSLLLKLKKNSRKVLRTGFTNKDADEQWVTDLIKVDFSQAEQRVSLHLSGH